MEISLAPARAKFYARIRHDQCMKCLRLLSKVDLVVVAQLIGHDRWLAVGTCCCQYVELDSIIIIKSGLGSNPTKGELHKVRERISAFLDVYSIPPFHDSEVQVLARSPQKKINGNVIKLFR